ncbi:MAG: hypothetical protein GX256_09610 [Fretibacterium sp.]|nr:hypothetical protein [Fretibacterium sp.]
MALITCRLCGKIFTAAGGRSCPDCLDRLDKLYPQVREVIRSNPRTHFNVDTLAEKIGVDIRDVQALVDMGYLDRDLDQSFFTAEDSSRQQLAREFERTLNSMKAESAARISKGPSTYGQQVYSKDRYNKDRKR